jgi:hypothetical protein
METVEQPKVDRFDELMQEMKASGFETMTYKPDQKLEITGEFFVALTNYVAYTRSVMNSFEEGFKRLKEASESALDNTAKMTFLVMEKHMEFCKAGNTVTSQQMDELDAKVKIKSEKQNVKGKSKKSA